MPAKAWNVIKQTILAHGAKAVRQIDPHKVPTARWVRMKCQYGCGGYGQCLCCPPHSPTPEQTRAMLDEYDAAFLIHWGSESPGRRALAEIERETFLRGYHKAFALGSGPCDLCRGCALEGHCRHPDQARPAMEACGIDVFATARAAGLPIRVVATMQDAPNFYSLLLVE